MARAALGLALVVTALAAVVRLPHAFHLLLEGSPVVKALDLRCRFDEVHLWFAGKPVYAAYPLAWYPPASLVLLWPALGWLPFRAVRWLWAVTTAGGLAWLAWLLVRAAGAGGRAVRLLVALTVVSMQAVSLLIAVGQIALHVLPVAIAGVLLAARRPRTLGPGALASLAILLSLVKPTVAWPFWCLLAALGSPWLASSVVAGYGALTALSCAFQPASIVSLLGLWLKNTSAGAGQHGYGNLHYVLAALGLGRFSPLATAVTMIAFAAWAWRHRRADVWLLLGAAGLLARLATYHDIYDDVLILLPMVSLLRVARSGEAGRPMRRIAGGLLALAWLCVVAPGRFSLLPEAWQGAVGAIESGLWLAMLAFLLAAARGSGGAAAVAR